MSEINCLFSQLDYIDIDDYGENSTVSLLPFGDRCFLFGKWNCQNIDFACLFSTDNSYVTV